MAFRNPAVAGTYLVRAAIQSPNYIAGSAGWSINRDGTSEFNAGTFRGAIEAGSLTGQHFWVNNPSTGDVIDVYNSSNKLVLSIDATGRLVATSSASTANVVINGGTVFFEDTAQTPNLPPLINASLGPDATELNLIAGHPQHAANGVNGAFITLITGDTSASEWINTEQRGVQGAMLQTDISTNANQLVHVDLYSATVSGTGGMATFSHNCNFTPQYGFVAPITHFSQWNWNSGFGTNGFTSTQAQITMFQPAGGAVGNGITPTFFGVFFG